VSGNVRSNAIIISNVNGVHLEGVANVRAFVFNHFSIYFKSSTMDWMNLLFKRLFGLEGGELIRSFIEERGKHAV